MNGDEWGPDRTTRRGILTSLGAAVGTGALVGVAAATKNESSASGSSDSDRENLALNQPVRASSTQPYGFWGADFAPSNVVDGKSSTRWSSGFEDPQWISIDLGSEETIDRVTLDWRHAYGEGYSIQVSTDGSNWETVYTETSGTGGVDEITFEPVSARYVRMYGRERGTPWGYSLWSFDVYRSDDPATTTTLPASSQEVEDTEASSTDDVEGPVVHRVDGTVQIDGRVDDAWDAADVLSMDTIVRGDTEATGEARLLYDDRNLYVLVDVSDDTPYHDSLLDWNDDSVELFIDVGNDKLGGYSSDDHIYKIRRDGSDLTPMHDSPTEGVSYATMEYNGGYRVEVALPWSTIGDDSEAGEKLGFDVHANDDFNGDSRDGKLSWHNEDDSAWMYPSKLGTVTLEDA